MGAVLKRIFQWQQKIRLARHRGDPAPSRQNQSFDTATMSEIAPLPDLDHSRFLIAGIQMPVPISGKNIPAMAAQVEKTMAIHPGVEMIVFSELAAHGPLHFFTQDDLSADETVFRDLARKHAVWIIPGSMFVRRGGKVYNQAVVISPEGEIVGRYDKMFPFLPFEADVAGGTEFLVFDVPNVGRFGLSICYDIWFPETTRVLTSAGVEVLIHPVLTGTTDRQAELAIVQATAAMFQCYVFDVNGLDAGGIGRSLVADPVGNVVYQSGEIAAIFPIMVDLGLVRQVRSTGGNGLGQVLKSWRDRSTEFPVHGRSDPTEYLASLGPLQSLTRRKAASDETA